MKHSYHFLKAVIPQKGDGKKEILRKIVVIVSTVLIVICAAVILSYCYGSYMNGQENVNLRKIYRTSSSQPSKAAKGKGASPFPDFAALYKKNHEIKGWLTVPKTGIDYPVLQSGDNEKYLKTDFNNNKARDGSIFLDYRDSIKPMSQNLIIYGHNMRDGQMFCNLENYEPKDGNDYVGFYNSSPLITFGTLYESAKWKIFAVFVTPADENVSGALYYLDTGFSGSAEFDGFIKEVRKRSFVNTSVDVRYSDKLLTLSTCDYAYPKSPDGDHARLVVMARRVRSGESDAVAPAKKNNNVFFPEYYYKVWGKGK